MPGNVLLYLPRYCKLELGITFSPLWHFFNEALTSRNHEESYIDREGELKLTPFKTMVTPLPAFDPAFNKSFAQIATERAREILDAHPDKTIDIFWSGGTDSTVIAVAFLLEATPAEWERIRFRYKRWNCNGRTSIDTYPKFFFEHIKPKNKKTINCFVGNATGRFYDTDPNVIAINGEYADHILGSSYQARFELVYGAGVAANAAWQPILEAAGHEPEHIAAANQILDRAPAGFPRDQLVPALQWISFNISRNKKIYRTWVSWDHNPVNGQIFAFYDSPDFQQYSIHRMSSAPARYSDAGIDYKPEAKKFVVDFNGDTDYLAAPKIDQSVGVKHPTKIFALETGERFNDFTGFEYLLNP